MSSTKSDEVLLRNYPKVIFFWPLFFTSLILWVIQLIINAFGGVPNLWLSNFWLLMFFVNLFVVSFDFSSTKFFILILAIVVISLIVVFLVLPNLPAAGGGGGVILTFNVALTSEFYLIMTIIFGFILAIILINSRFSYWKIERNEIYHKSGIFSSAERYPVEALRIRKEIPDVFEFLILRAGSITLLPGRSEEVIYLPTVLNVNKKADKIDHLLSHVSVEPDEVD
ncbi:MAG: hypothetical protein EU549_04485 [Promethearchaeota archaeon]|nr:MAG: hypothetical protein EU549_04485 [Candidatus Lokiarchaeota archaeon]